MTSVPVNSWRMEADKPSGSGWCFEQYSDPCSAVMSQPGAAHRFNSYMAVASLGAHVLRAVRMRKRIVDIPVVLKMGRIERYLENNGRDAYNAYMCSFCGIPLPDTKIGFRDLCTTCGRELHICRHCRFFKPGVYQDCTETVPEAVKDKERMNFCEYFKADPASVSGGRARDSSNAAKSAFDNLFGN